MTPELLKKLNELSEDARIVEDLKNAESVGEAIETFSKYGIEITEEELGEFCKEVMQEGELTEDSLESVAGGGRSKFSEGIMDGTTGQDYWGGTISYTIGFWLSGGIKKLKARSKK